MLKEEKVAYILRMVNQVSIEGGMILCSQKARSLQHVFAVQI